MTFDQVWIVLCQGLAFWLLAQERPETSRWGHPVALAAQPAYVYACWTAQQWGMLALTFWLAGCFAWGTYTRFWRVR